MAFSICNLTSKSRHPLTSRKGDPKLLWLNENCTSLLEIIWYAHSWKSNVWNCIRIPRSFWEGRDQDFHSFLRSELRESWGVALTKICWKQRTPGEQRVPVKVMAGSGLSHDLSQMPLLLISALWLLFWSNCFTMLCYFLLYNKVNQLYVYISLLFLDK